MVIVSECRNDTKAMLDERVASLWTHAIHLSKQRSILKRFRTTSAYLKYYQEFIVVHQRRFHQKWHKSRCNGIFCQFPWTISIAHHLHTELELMTACRVADFHEPVMCQVDLGGYCVLDFIDVMKSLVKEIEWP